MMRSSEGKSWARSSKVFRHLCGKGDEGWQMLKKETQELLKNVFQCNIILLPNFDLLHKP